MRFVTDLVPSAEIHDLFAGFPQDCRQGYPRPATQSGVAAERKIGTKRPGERLWWAGRRARDRRPPLRSCTVLNRFDRSSPMAGEAEVKYLDGDFRVLRPGAFVRCAVTGTPIPLEELKYWSVDLQEAYASLDIVLQRHYPGRAQR